MHYGVYGIVKCEKQLANVIYTEFFSVQKGAPLPKKSAALFGQTRRTCLGPALGMFDVFGRTEPPHFLREGGAY